VTRSRRGAARRTQLDFALASRTVFYAMAGVMAVGFVVSLLAMPGGKVEQEVVA
jgi:hypothetical protein